MKRALKWLGILLLVALLLIAVGLLTFPYWFGSVLHAGGQRFGVSFSKYERLTGGRFALADLVSTNRYFDLRVKRAEGFLPHVWFRRLNANRGAAFLQLDGWRAVVHERTAPKGGATNKSVYAIWKRAEPFIARAREWVPKATLLNGIVEFQNKEYTFPVISWEAGKLDAGGVWPISAVPFEIKGKLTGELPYQLSYLMAPLDIRARLQWMETNAFLNTKAALFYKESRVDIDADFEQEGILPKSATLKAPNFRIPADLIKLDKYRDFTGSLSAEWRTNAYQLQLKARAEPIVGAKVLPADIELSARGDTNSIFIESARSTAPGLELSISDPIELSYRGRLLSDRSEIRIAADLEKLPWLELKGTFEGTLLVKKGEKFPIATIRGKGTKVEVNNIRAEKFELAAELDWPRLERFQLDAQIGTNGLLGISGSGDLQARTLGESSIRFDGSLATHLLPRGVRLSHARLAATFSGNISNLTHSGEVELRDFSVPRVQPLQVECSWKADQIAFEQIALRARAGPAVLFLRGAGSTDETRTNLILRELTLSKGDEPYLQLAQEATVSLMADRQIKLSSMRLVGTNKELNLAGGISWPKSAQLECDARNINPELFQNFVTHSLRGLDLQRFTIAARWSNGLLTGKLDGNFSTEEERFQRLGAEISLELDESGLALSRMMIWDVTGQIGAAQGFLPLSVAPFERPWLRLSSKDQIDFELQTGTNEAFWATVSQFARVQITNAAVDLTVHGTTERPIGEFHLRADALKLAQINQELPAIGPVDARIALNEHNLRIREFSLRVLDQPVSVTGNLKLGSNFWSQRREEILEYALDHGDLRVEAPEVNLAPFATFLPRYLSPQGKLVINIAMRPGRDFDGVVQVRGVQTRPISNIGVVQSVGADVQFRGKEVLIEDLSGVIGGERMVVQGHFDLSPESVAKGYPDLDLSITGKNLPLARNPDIILRSDLDLRVRNGANQVPVITGNANLRDSFLLRDLTTLAHGRLAGPGLRPPFFSIQQAPMDDWRLDVRVRGENFMRVRSPFFLGAVSANFHLVGSAREPMSLGEATISAGRVLFPFGTLEIRQASAFLTTQDPYVPRIFAVATGRAFGFDVRMEVEGTANQPVIQFSSVPALSSEQIILMLTTGQIPREDFRFSNESRVEKLAVFVGKSLLSKLRPGQPDQQRLIVRSGRDVTETGRQTYEVEFQLSPRWSLVGEYDRFGALNGHVKWRVLSR